MVRNSGWVSAWLAVTLTSCLALAQQPSLDRKTLRVQLPGLQDKAVRITVPRLGGTDQVAQAAPGMAIDRARQLATPRNKATRADRSDPLAAIGRCRVRSPTRRAEAIWWPPCAMAAAWPSGKRQRAAACTVWKTAIGPTRWLPFRKTRNGSRESASAIATRSTCGGPTTGSTCASSALPVGRRVNWSSQATTSCTCRLPAATNWRSACPTAPRRAVRLAAGSAPR